MAPVLDQIAITAITGSCQTITNHLTYEATLTVGSLQVVPASTESSPLATVLQTADLHQALGQHSLRLAQQDAVLDLGSTPMCSLDCMTLLLV